jgi:hypothetical protein
VTSMVDLPPNVEQAYLAQAQARALPVGEVLRETLVAALPADEAALSPEEWIDEYEAWGARNAHKNFPVLTNEALRRESIYDDRGL